MKQQNKRFNVFRNLGYSIEGIIEVAKNEMPFKIELICFVIFQIIAFVLPIELYMKAILSCSLFIPLIAELANSAIERVVDLVTEDYHILAKHAKDAGSALVFISLLMTGCIWLWVLYFGLFSWQS